MEGTGPRTYRSCDRKRLCDYRKLKGFAEYYRFIGEPKIGALMTVGVDYAAEELRRPEWDFERTQTRMQGALHCDFRLHKGISR